MSNNVGKYIRTLEIRKKASGSLKKYFNNPEVKKVLSERNSGKNNPHYGKQHSLEHRSKMHFKMSGRNNHQWKHGENLRGYDFIFNDRFKRKIRQRDNYICMICGIHSERLSKALNIHHINYNPLLTIEQNCISLCFPCHAKTNGNRKEWQRFLQDLLKRKYGYSYNKGLVKISIKKENVF